DFKAAAPGRPIDGDVPVKATRPQQSGIEHVRPVGRGQDNDHLIGLEAVHLAEDLIQRLLALIRTTAHARAAHAADRVNLVNEEQTGGVVLRGLEHVADAAGADADEHLNEFRAADAVKGHARLAGHRASEQRLAGAWWADQEDPLGDLSAEALKLLRRAQELDHFLQLALGALHIGDVVKSDARLVPLVTSGRTLDVVAQKAAAERVA